MPKHHLAGLWAIRALFLAIVNIEHIDIGLGFVVLDCTLQRWSLSSFEILS